MQGVADHNLKVINETQGAPGISEIVYGRDKINGRGQPDGLKTFNSPKTVYDSKIYSDDRIFQMGKEAVVTGYDNAVVNGNRFFVEKIDGIKFAVYLDPDTKQVMNFHPTLKGK